METKLCGFSGLNVLISNNQASKLLVNQIHTYSNVITLIIYTFIHSFIPSIIYIYIYNIIIYIYMVIIIIIIKFRNARIIITIMMK